jgi:hypothetical protein
MNNFTAENAEEAKIIKQFHKFGRKFFIGAYTTPAKTDP